MTEQTQIEDVIGHLQEREDRLDKWLLDYEKFCRSELFMLVQPILLQTLGWAGLVPPVLDVRQNLGTERRLKKFIFAFQYYSLLKRAVLLYSQSKFRCLALCEALES